MKCAFGQEKNLPCKTPDTIRKSSLVDIGRCLDDRRTSSDKELLAKAYNIDTETTKQN